MGREVGPGIKKGRENDGWVPTRVEEIVLKKKIWMIGPFERWISSMNEYL
jgi:hypothetical protein